MVMVYERTEDGITTRVTAEEALREGEAAMLDRVTDRAHVRKISSDSGRYDITYTDGRRVVLRPVDEQSEPDGPEITPIQTEALRRLYDNPGNPGFYGSVRTRNALRDPGLIDWVRGCWVVTNLGRVVLGVAEPAQELPAGTRVTTSVGPYAGQFGTVQEGNRGTVTDTDSENYGRAYVSVHWDPTPEIPWGETFRPFADNLAIVGAPAASDTRSVRGKEDSGTERPKPSACMHGRTPRPDVTGDPIKACASAGGGIEWGAFNAEGCTYAYDCAVDVANWSAQENEAETTPDDPESRWQEMCRDHRDQGQPKDGCEECDAEPDEDTDQDEDEYDEPLCGGHAGEDDDLVRGVNIGETTYCDGSCNPRRPRYLYTVMVGRTPTHFNDRAAADRCAAQYGATVTVN